MTIGPRSQCSTCARLRSPFSEENTRGLEDSFCAAFPDGIPDEIYDNAVDHRRPVDGDHGLQWISDKGKPFPEDAFVPRFLGPQPGDG